jgi:exosortase
MFKKTQVITILVAITAILFSLPHVLAVLDKPQFQYVLLVPFASFLLYRKVSLRAAAESLAVQQSFALSIVSIVASVIAIIMIIASTLLVSPWLACLGALQAVMALLVCNTPQIGWAWLKPWLALHLVLPPPLGLDELITRELRIFATDMSSGILDRIGTLHLRYASVIETPEKKFFVADACSGIHSLYVIIAAAVFLGFWNNRSAFHLGLLVMAGCTLVLFENVVRIVSVVYLLKYGWDFSTGQPHTILGLLLFLLTIVSLVSADQFLKFLFSMGSGEEKNEKQASAFVERGLNYLGAGAASNRLVAFAKVNLILFLLFGLICIFPFYFFLQSPLQAVSSFLHKDPVFPDLPDDFLNETFACLKRTGKRTLMRTEGDPFGRISQQWDLKGDKYEGTFSIDYPYSQLHDLCLCYKMIGWKALTVRRIEQDELSQEFGIITKGSVVVASFEKTLFGKAFLVYSATDAQGVLDSATKDADKSGLNGSLLRRFYPGERIAGQSDRVGRKPPFVQIQLFVITPDEFYQQELDDLLREYVTSRDRFAAVVLQRTE